MSLKIGVSWVHKWGRSLERFWLIKMNNLFSYTVIALVSVFVLYGIGRAPALIKGPEIILYTPKDNAVYSSL